MKKLFLTAFLFIVFLPPCHAAQEETAGRIKAANDELSAMILGRFDAARAKTIVEKRSQDMILLMREGADSLDAFILPDAVKSKLAPDTAKWVESVLPLEGRYELAIVETPSARRVTRYHFLKTRGRSIQLFFAKNEVPDPGRIKPAGLLTLKKAVLLNEKGDETTPLAFVSLEDAKSTPPAAATATQAVATGNFSTLCLIGDFPDEASDVTADVMSQKLFTNPDSVNALYQESSFGNVSFSGDSYGPFLIPASPATCGSGDPIPSLNAWAAALESAAAAEGIDVGGYHTKVYILPLKKRGCGFVGGNINLSADPRAWVDKSVISHVVPHHEIGHTLGMDHATAVYPETCPTRNLEYCDTSDVMGNSINFIRRHNNAPHKAKMTWLPKARNRPIFSSGTYQIAHLEAAGTVPQMLFYTAPDGFIYKMSFRRPVGFDAACTGTSVCGQYMEKVSVHYGDVRTTLVGLLSDGMTYSDAVHHVNFSVTMQSHDASSATVAVSIQPIPCTPQPPGLSVWPTQSFTSPGFPSESFTVSVANADDPYVCQSSRTFTIEPTNVPAGWTYTLGVSSVILAPGEGTFFGWTLVPPAGTAEGSYPNIQAIIRDAVTDQTSDPASGKVTVWVRLDTAIPIAAVTGQIANGRAYPQVTATDDVRVTRIVLYLDGQFYAESGTSPFYPAPVLLSTLTIGPHAFTADVYDQEEKKSETASWTFNRTK